MLGGMLRFTDPIFFHTPRMLVFVRGELELNALTNVLKVPIRVYQADPLYIHSYVRFLYDNFCFYHQNLSPYSLRAHH